MATVSLTARFGNHSLQNVLLMGLFFDSIKPFGGPWFQATQELPKSCQAQENGNSEHEQIPAHKPKPPELQKHAKRTNRYTDSVKKSCKIAANPTSQILIATKLNEHISTAEFLSFP